MEIKVYPSMIYYVDEVEPNILSNNEEAASMCILGRTEVMYQSEEYCDIDYCKENNILTFNEVGLPHVHCIVCVEGNVMISVKRKPIDGKSLSTFFVPAFRDFLINKGLNASIDNNDMMIDGFKVASGTEGETNGWRYLGYQISLNQDIEVIKKVCKKPMVKMPKGLSDFGVTTDEVVDFCNNFWKNY